MCRTEKWQGGDLKTRRKIRQMWLLHFVHNSTQLDLSAIFPILGAPLRVGALWSPHTITEWLDLSCHWAPDFKLLLMWKKAGDSSNTRVPATAWEIWIQPDQPQLLWEFGEWTSRCRIGQFLSSLSLCLPPSPYPSPSPSLPSSPSFALPFK